MATKIKLIEIRTRLKFVKQDFGEYNTFELRAAKSKIDCTACSLDRYVFGNQVSKIIAHYKNNKSKGT